MFSRVVRKSRMARSLKELFFRIQGWALGCETLEDVQALLGEGAQAGLELQIAG